MRGRREADPTGFGRLRPSPVGRCANAMFCGVRTPIRGVRTAAIHDDLRASVEAVRPAVPDSGSGNALSKVFGSGARDAQGGFFLEETLGHRGNESSVGSCAQAEKTHAACRALEMAIARSLPWPTRARMEPPSFFALERRNTLANRVPPLGIASTPLEKDPDSIERASERGRLCLRIPDSRKENQHQGGITKCISSSSSPQNGKHLRQPKGTALARSPRG